MHESSLKCDVKTRVKFEVHVLLLNLRQRAAEMRSGQRDRDGWEAVPTGQLGVRRNPPHQRVGHTREGAQLHARWQNPTSTVGGLEA